MGWGVMATDRHLRDFFADLPDPRVTGRYSHDLADIVLIVVCGTIGSSRAYWPSAPTAGAWRFRASPRGASGHHPGVGPGGRAPAPRLLDLLGPGDELGIQPGRPLPGRGQ